MRRLAFLAVGACLWGCAVNGSVRADTLNIVVENTSAPPGSLGSFDVLLQNKSAVPVTIAGFSVDVLLSDPTFVSFTAVSNATTAPYIFSVKGSLPPGFSSNLLPMEAAGSDNAASGGQVVNPGETWGLANVSYVVDPAAPLGTVVGVAVEPFPQFLPAGGTSLTDPTGAPVTFDSVNGTITVSPGTAAPEPASLTLLGITGLSLAGWRCLRRYA